MSKPSELDLATLNREIAQLETEAARLEIDRSAAAKTAGRLSRRQRYLRLAAWLRKPAASHALFPFALLTIGPLLAGVAAFVLSSLMVSSWTLAAIAFFVIAVAAACLLAALLYRPANALLPAAIAEAEAKWQVESTRLEELASSMAEIQRRLAASHEQRQDFAKSDKLQRAMLLQRNWKALRGSEWEDFVVEVCRTLGANVQRGAAMNPTPVAPETPATGARGVIRRAPTTLFVTFSPRRLAVVAVSEVNPFHAAAVRQVIDELTKQGCEEMGIITNARITAGSKEYARSRRCILVGEEEFPDFVLGNTPL